MNDGVVVPQTSDNADLRSGARPSKKARTSNEFPSVGNAAGRSDVFRAHCMSCSIFSRSRKR